MQNAVGYLKAVCQYSASNNSPNEIAAQLKLRAMSVSRDYLCNNDAVNLKGNETPTPLFRSHNPHNMQHHQLPAGSGCFSTSNVILFLS